MIKRGTSFHNGGVQHAQDLSRSSGEREFANKFDKAKPDIANPEVGDTREENPAEIQSKFYDKGMNMQPVIPEGSDVEQPFIYDRSDDMPFVREQENRIDTI